MYNDVFKQRRPDFTPEPKPSKKRRNLVLLLLAVIVIAFAGAAIVMLKPKTPDAKTQTSPVPASVSSAVNFPIYYPDQSKLPAGYTLDLSSFAVPVKNGATYIVTYDSGKKIVFSLQTKPSDNELQSFRGNFIPIRIEYNTKLGQADLGTYHAQTLVSLPINDGPWIVITAPPDINQTQLKQVLSSLKRD